MAANIRVDREELTAESTRHDFVRSVRVEHLCVRYKFKLPPCSEYERPGSLAPMGHKLLLAPGYGVRGQRVATDSDVERFKIYNRRRSDLRCVPSGGTSVPLRDDQSRYFRGEPVIQTSMSFLPYAFLAEENACSTVFHR